jgi:hypothetical protein
MSGFWSRNKRRFSLERLKELLSTLQKNPIWTPRNRPVVVETLRELAELLVWGDQNDEKLFDYFLEKNMFGVLLRIMEQKDSIVQVQLLQTLSILLENISTSSSLYYLLSCDRVNSVITHDFDFSDEELMAYYISFLKTLSLKLDVSTVQFFFNHESQQFPLYIESIKFFNHSEGMVRTGVRTISLAVFKVSDPSVRSFIVSGKSAPYFSNLVWFIQSKSEELQTLVRQLSGAATNQLSHRFRDCVDELSDLLYYIQDIYALGISELAVAMSSNLLDKLAHFVEALSSVNSAVSSLQPPVALYVLGQLFFVLREPNLVHALAALLLSGRSPLLPLLSIPALSLPASFLLLCIARSRFERKAKRIGNVSLPLQHLFISAAPALLGASLARQSSLLQAILSDSTSSIAAGVPVPSPDDSGLSAALVALLAQPAVNIRALQCVVLLLRALQVPVKTLPVDAYRAAAAPLAAALSSSPVATLEAFERGMSTYRQLNFAKLANEPALFLLPPREEPDEAVQRFLALRDLWTGQRETLLPLQPAAVPLLAPGAVATIPASVQTWNNGRIVLAVHETHLALLETSLDEDSQQLALPPTAKTIASMPVQHVHVQFVQRDNTCSQSLPSGILRLSLPDNTVSQDVVLPSAEMAAQAQAAIIARRNDVVDSKIRQLAALFADVPES